jgi:hypothetical protein
LGKSLWVNERLRAELDYCVPLGIPHSRFLAWTEDDQDKALAYTAEMRTVCPSCGTREIDWEMDDDAFVGDLRYCEGCARQELELENKPENAKGLHPRLVTVEYARKKARELAERDGAKV